MPRHSGESEFDEIDAGDISSVVHELRYLKRDVNDLRGQFSKLELVERLTKLEMAVGIGKWIVGVLAAIVVGNAGYVVTQMVKGVK